MAVSEVEAGKVVVNEDANNASDQPPTTGAAPNAAASAGDGNADAVEAGPTNGVEEGAENGEKAAEVNGAVEGASKLAAANTVAGILNKVKNNPDMKDSDKVDTLCVLVAKIIEENHVLRADLGTMNDHIAKSAEANDAIKKLNSAYKQQIALVQEENILKLKEEQMKSATCVKNYQTTMDELSTLLETHTGQNSRLRDENINMADKLTQLCHESEKRDNQVQGRLKEYDLQVKLLEHQVTKAHLEKAEVKADMTKERIEIAQDLMLERERSSNLQETVQVLKQQSNLYQEQLMQLTNGEGAEKKNFQFFKTQIDKLTLQMNGLEKDTHDWRNKYEDSSQQVKKMNTQSLDREKEIGQLKKKLDQMVKLNKTLADERTKLNQKIKAIETNSS